MRHASLADMCCPTCGTALQITVAESESDNIVEGLLQCAGCSARYPIRKGIPYLLSADRMQASKVREMQGWVTLWEKRGMYDNPTLEDSYRLPYLGGEWVDVARMFDMALQEMNLQGGEVILDLGAGQGWASRYFAEHGCRVFAVDIVADEQYGLGRSWAIMEHTGVYFEPVLADGEDLPFFPGRFNIAFLCGALHHFERFDRVLEEIYRVLKPGGSFIAAAEPSVSARSRERDVQALLEETELGITERRPKVLQYWWALRRAGFNDIRIDTFETHRASASQIHDWVMALGQASFPETRPHRKMLVRLACDLILKLPHKWVGQSILQLTGGTLFLRAVKTC